MVSWSCRQVQKVKSCLLAIISFSYSGTGVGPSGSSVGGSPGASGQWLPGGQGK